MKRANLLLLAMLSLATISYAQKDKSGPDDHLIKKNLLVDGNISSAGGKDLVLQTNQSTRITVLNTNGYIGMGITNPQERLHINGSVRGSSTGGALRIQTQHGWFDLGPQDGQSAHLSTGMSRFLLNKDLWVDGAFSSNGNRNLVFQTNGATRITVLDNNGFVGIGLANPSEALEVEGNIKATEGLISQALTTETLNATDGTFSNDLSIGNKLNVDGLVGIGVEAPTEKLEVGGNAVVTETLTVNDLQSQTGTFAQDVSIEGNANIANNTVVNGNLGVGVETPSEKLEIAGNAVISDKITTNDIESNTASINDQLNVENLIQLNGHMGIGVESPTEALEVAGNVKATEQISSSDLESITATVTDKLTVNNEVNVGSKLGIGVDAPQEALEVAGNAKVSQDLEAASITTETMSITGDFDVDGNSRVGQNSIVMGQMGVGVETPTEKLDVDGNIKASEAVKSNTLETVNATITDGIVITNNANIGGNLGLGVENPSEKLEVSGNVNVSETLRARNLETESMTVDGDFTVKGNSSVALNSIVSGQLGVGIDAPTEKLDVAGNIKASETVKSNALETVNATITDGIVITNNANIGGNLGLGVARPAEKLEVSGNAVVTETLSAKNLETESMTVDGDFAVNGNSTVAQNSIVSGQLGVGVDAPIEKLDVAGNIKASEGLLSNTLETANATITDGIVITNNASIGGNLGLGVEAPTEKLEVSGNALITETLSAKNLETESMTVDADFAVNGNSKVAQNSIISGNLGVGVETATEKIDVAGNIKASETVKSNAIETVNANITDGIVITNNANIGGNLGLGVEVPTEKLEVAGNAVVSETLTAKALSTESMSVSGDFEVLGSSNIAQNSIISGFVGVGVTSPSEKLEVAGNIRTTESLMANNAQITNALSASSLNISGNVGVGIVNPTRKLEVDGAVVATDFLMPDGSALKTSPWTESGSDLTYTIGNVGIGTNDTKGYIFAVAGHMVAEEITVEVQTKWPDYVFSTNYKLMSLAETERYIKENHHLPEVPSAQEMEEEGVNLSEMNALLLKKIEELTLHQIELMKMLEKQQKQINELSGSK